MDTGSGCEINARPVAKGTRWNDVAEVLHEGEVAFELERLVLIEIDLNVELLVAAGAEAERDEVERDGVENVESEIRQRAGEGEATRRWRVRGYCNRLANFAVDRERCRSVVVRRERNQRSGNLPALWLPIEFDDDGFAAIFQGELRFWCVCGRRRAWRDREQVGELDGPEQLRLEIPGQPAEEIVGIELILRGVGGAPRQRPMGAAEIRQIEVGGSDPTGFVGGESDGHLIRRERPADFLHDLGEHPRIRVEIILDIGVIKSDRRVGGGSEQLLDGRKVYRRLVQHRH